MQKLIIATLATATLGKNIAVQNMLIKHTDTLEHGPKGSSSAPDQARIKMDLGADGEIRDKVAGTGLHGRVVKNGLHGRVGNRDRVGGLRDRLTKAGLRARLSSRVGLDSERIVEQLLENFETYRGVLDTYCEENNCIDDMDLMADAFETIEEMNDEEIDIALAIYRVANRLVDLDKVLLGMDEIFSKKFMCEIIKAIKEEVEIPKHIVKNIISEFDGDFESFVEQLKTVRGVVKLGHGFAPVRIPRTVVDELAPVPMPHC